MLHYTAFCLCHQEIDHGPQRFLLIGVAAVLAVDAQLLVGARPLAQDGVGVGHFLRPASCRPTG